MTITEKILAAHAGLDEVTPGQLVNCALDIVLANDVTAPIAIREFAKIGVEILSRLPIPIEGLIKAEGLLMSEKRGQYIMAFVSAMIAVALASMYPARRAARYDPVEVIRGAH